MRFPDCSWNCLPCRVRLIIRRSTNAFFSTSLIENGFRRKATSNSRLSTLAIASEGLALNETSSSGFPRIIGFISQSCRIMRSSPTTSPFCSDNSFPKILLIRSSFPPKRERRGGIYKIYANDSNLDFFKTLK